MRARYLTKPIETTPLALVLGTITGLVVVEVIHYRVEPRVFSWLIANDYYGWAEFLAGGPLKMHDHLWPNRKEGSETPSSD